MITHSIPAPSDKPAPASHPNAPAEFAVKGASPAKASAAAVKPRLATAKTVAVTSDLLSKSTLIFKYTHESATSLVLAFDVAKAARGAPRGVLTDQEQDILRASLVMSCAGLDAALKQAIRDCLEYLLERMPLVRDGFEKFIRKRISGEGDLLELSSGAKFLAQV